MALITIFQVYLFTSLITSCNCIAGGNEPKGVGANELEGLVQGCADGQLVSYLLVKIISGLEIDIRELKHQVDGMQELKAQVANGDRIIRELKAQAAYDGRYILELKDQVAKLESKNRGHGSVFVRWGRTTCPGNTTRMIYRGIASGGHYWEPGDGTNMLCLPESPTWGKYKDGHDRQRAHVYGVEIDIEANPIFKDAQNNQDQPCVVCHTNYPVTHMFPGRVNCYPGWSLQYSGYLMSSEHLANVNREYFCMDVDPEPRVDGGADNNQGIVYLVESRCGSLPCPPYVEGREIACAVCSL